MKITKYQWIRIIMFILSIIFIVNIYIFHSGDIKRVNTINTEAAVDNNMRGVWVSLISNIDYPIEPTTKSSVLKKNADDIITVCSDIGINNIFLQVRPTADSIYPSAVFPYSRHLTGTQGVAPDENFDYLKYWIEEAHKKNIKIHAWINPYRITTNGQDEFFKLSSSNPAILHPDYVVNSPDGNYYFDPGIPAVRDMIVDGVVEIVENYDVDGIHMDDYFYPSKGIDDSNSYTSYGNGKDKGEWRVGNVNKLVSNISSSIKKIKPDVLFGISPSGIWANKSNNPLGSNTAGMESYYGLYADTRQWALDEIIDYIAPQVYWNIGFQIADYEVLANWWADTLKNSKTKLYIGIADYKVGTENNEIWKNDGVGEVKRQIQLNRGIDKIEGEIHFSYNDIKQNTRLYNMLKSTYENTNTAQTTSAGVSAVVKNDKAYLNKSLKIMVNDKFFYPLESDNSPLYPITYKDSTYLPARAVSECLGAQVEWNEQTRTVSIKTGGDVSFVNKAGIYPEELIEVDIVINGTNIEVDGNKLDSRDEKGNKTEPFIYKDRTYLPVRALAKALGAEISYISESKTVVIKK